MPLTNDLLVGDLFIFSESGLLFSSQTGHLIIRLGMCARPIPSCQLPFGVPTIFQEQFLMRH